MNRQLTCSVTTSDAPSSLAQELVHYGFINEVRLNFILFQMNCLCLLSEARKVAAFVFVFFFCAKALHCL